MKILLLEDDPDQLSLRSMLLEHAGFEPAGAHDTASALALAVSEKPSCAVVDLNVPTERDGLQFIRDLKALDPSIPVVVLSGGDPSRFEDIPERRLIAAFFVKGSPAGRLLQMLESLARGSLGRAATQP